MKSSCPYTDLIRADGACSSIDEAPAKARFGDTLLPILGNILWPFLKAGVLTFLWVEKKLAYRPW